MTFTVLSSDGHAWCTKTACKESKNDDARRTRPIGQTATPNPEAVGPNNDATLPSDMMNRNRIRHELWC